MGCKFTWYKNYPCNVTIWECLDRASGTNECVSSFLASKVMALECWSSNHKPIVICPLGIPERRSKPWRFKQAWLEIESCHDSIKFAWRTNNSSSPMAQVKGKIRVCQKQFSTISQRLLSTRRNCYRRLKRRL